MMMKSTASLALALCVVAGSTRAQADACDLPEETIAAIDFAKVAASCEYIGGDQSYESCDTCLGSFLGDFVLPLYPSLGLDIATFPKSPSQLAAELAAGNDSGLSAIGQGGPCGEYFTEEAAAAGADLQTYAFSIIGCDTRVPWGPEVVAAVQRFNPEFVPDEA